MVNMLEDKKNDRPIPTVIIGFNKEWEINNWYDTIHSQAKYGLRQGGNKWGLGEIPADLPSLLEKIQNEEEKKIFIEQRLELEIKRPEIVGLIQESVNKARVRWDQVKYDFFPILSDMLDVPSEQFESAYNAYFTLSKRAPFGKNSFMFTRYLDFSDLAMHEIMHIEFLKAYMSYCLEKGLNEEKISHLKEILTVLLNADVRHLLTREEPGYTKHEKLRAEVLEIYKKSGSKKGDFKSFLDKTILLIKRAEFV